MAKRRGFFADLQHQHQLDMRRRQQQTQAAYKAQLAAARAAEKAQRDYERLQAQLASLTAAGQKAAEKEALRLHSEARVAEAEAMNSELARAYDEVDSVLAATLELDDWVDLEGLRQAISHPPFDPPPALTTSAAPPPPVVLPPEPVWTEPPPPGGLGGMLGGKRRHEESVARAKEAFANAQDAWRGEVARLGAWRAQQIAAHEGRERKRMADLKLAQARYSAECKEREREANEANARLDVLINELAFDVPSAVQDYVGIVLGNSVYPDCFPVEHEYSFDLGLRELSLSALVPGPDQVPAVKEYRYVQSKDEIVPTALTQKDAKARYANAVAQVALRSLHEVFEADRAGRIHSISLTVGVDRIDPAIGRPAMVPLVAVAADRESFMMLNLANVVPSATLTHLGAQVSKSPYDLVAIDTSKGVRGR